MTSRIFLLMLPFITCAQSTGVPTGVRLTPPANVPATVMDRFRLDFPKASASWQKHGDSDWAATFKDDSTQLPRMAVYDVSGNVVEGRKRVEKGIYPQTIDQYFHTHYPTDQYMVWQHDRRDKTRNWYVIRGADTTWFREDGTYAYQLNVSKPDPLVDSQDAVTIQSLWALNQQRLAILEVAEKNGFVTNTRQIQAEKMDKELRSIASAKQVALSTERDEKESARLTSLSELHGEQLAKQVNQELRKNSSQISRELNKASKSKDERVKALEEKFGGPDN